MSAAPPPVASSRRALINPGVTAHARLLHVLIHFVGIPNNRSALTYGVHLALLEENCIDFYRDISYLTDKELEGLAYTDPRDRTRKSISPHFRAKIRAFIAYYNKLA